MIKLTIKTILILIATGCSPSSSSRTDDFEPIVRDFESQLQKDLRDDDIGGSISAAIIKGETIIWSKAFGYSNKESKTLADTNTIYRTGSISKSFTAFLMMQLVEDGKIKLTDPVDQYLPEIKKLIGYSDSTRVTFFQLASHTSGLSREPTLEDAASGPIENWESKVLQSIARTSFENKPGKTFSYSNIGYGILGLSLSRVAKKSFLDLVKERIFIPLKMNNSYFVVPENKSREIAVGMSGGPFGEIDTETPRIEHRGRGYKVPNGGIYSTPNDLAKFMMCNMGVHPLLKPETLEIMHTSKTNGDEKYGLGFTIYEDKKLNAIEHSGSISGYVSQFIFDKNSRYGVIILRNYDWGTTNLWTRSHILLRDLSRLEKRSKG